MGLTSREKQAAWRARQAANARRVADLERAIADDAERMNVFACNAAALLFGISEESSNSAAVRRYAKQLQEQVDALALGSELPALAGVVARRADLMRQHAHAPTAADEAEILRQLRSVGGQ